MLSVEIKYSQTLCVDNIEDYLYAALSKGFSHFFQENETALLAENPVAAISCSSLFEGTIELADKVVKVDFEDTINTLFRVKAKQTIPLALGFFAYEYLSAIENITVPALQNLPIAQFYLFETITLINDVQVEKYNLNWFWKGSPLPKLDLKLPETDSTEQTAAPHNLCRLLQEQGDLTVLGSNFSAEEFQVAVEKIKDLILDGEVYQVNLSQRLEFNWPISPAMLIRKVISHSAPYKALLQLGIQQDSALAASISPELFLSIREGLISSKPIKGTRPRGTTQIEEQRLRKSLLSSEKDRAELAMIVDLLRNDLSKVCKIASVSTSDFPELATLEHVFHTYCCVTGELRDCVEFSKIINAAFPCGSITGAPKVAAMKIIAELERRPRGIYCGSIGYIGSNRSACFNVAIRSLLLRDQTVTLNAGGGIVLDSDPRAEYLETLSKLQGLFTVLDF